MNRDEELQHQYDRILDRYENALVKLHALADEEMKRIRYCSAHGERFYVRHTIEEAAETVLVTVQLLKLIHQFSWDADAN